MKILLPIDGSEASDEAVRFVQMLAQTNSIDVVVVTVSFDPSQYSIQPWIPEWTEQESNRVERILDRAKKTLEPSCYSVEFVEGTGATVPFLLNLAAQSHYDLIVVGAKGHSAISRILLGSVSDSIASYAKSSVLVVRPSEDHVPTLNKILVGYDKSVASREAAAELMEWQLDRGTDFTILSVVQCPYIFVGEGYLAEPISVTPSQVASVGETAERMASQLADRFPQTDSKTTVADHIGDAIVRAAEEEKVDLVVVGDTSHSLIGELLLGSTSKYVLRHAPCSVLISRHHTKMDESE
ncbi:Universal stress protein [Rubripirellula obstinata]|uniref:Universal stress protein n=1 Tax=Rubripirellula obstinata TaxID=406547 RepID=A0A5B1CC69_9BACT|nr:universal stress protein [Rubripirellula obstinata]KAA1258727.1 Universal stress protein [Rubripirellula obstinata]